MAKWNPISLDGLRTYPLKERPSIVSISDFGKPWTSGGYMRDWIRSLPRILVGNDFRQVVDSIVTAVKSREMAKQVYMVSLLAIEVDTDAERTYINTLAQQLGLEESDIDDIHRKLEIEKP